MPELRRSVKITMTVLTDGHLHNRGSSVTELLQVFGAANSREDLATEVTASLASVQDFVQSYTSKPKALTNFIESFVAVMDKERMNESALASEEEKEAFRDFELLLLRRKFPDMMDFRAEMVDLLCKFLPQSKVTSLWAYNLPDPFETRVYQLLAEMAAPAESEDEEE